LRLHRVTVNCSDPELSEIGALTPNLMVWNRGQSRVLRNYSKSGFDPGVGSNITSEPSASVAVRATPAGSIKI
jgi:hypothetical protein